MDCDDGIVTFYRWAAFLSSIYWWQISCKKRIIIQFTWLHFWYMYWIDKFTICSCISTKWYRNASSLEARTMHCIIFMAALFIQKYLYWFIGMEWVWGLHLRTYASDLELPTFLQSACHRENLFVSTLDPLPLCKYCRLYYFKLR